MKKVWKRRYLRLAKELGIKKTLELLYEDYRDGILSKSTYYRIRKLLLEMQHSHS